MAKLSKDEIIEKLAENNVALQKKSTELIASISKLTDRMDRMVSVFEEAAKHIKAGEDQPLMKRLEELLDQNRNLARGLILLEKYIKEKTPSFEPKPLPKSNF